MRKIGWLVSLAVATLVAAGLSFAAGPEVQQKVQHKIQLELLVDDDLIDIAAEELEVGEMRQLFTDSGKEVLLSRTDEGYEVEIDGEKIDLPALHRLHARGDGHGGSAKVFVQRRCADCDDEESHDVFFLGSGAAHKMMMKVDVDDVDPSVVWVAGDEDVHPKVVEIMSTVDHPGVVDHLRDVGILDRLDDDLREELIEALEDWQSRGLVWMDHAVVTVDEKNEE